MLRLSCRNFCTQTFFVKNSRSKSGKGSNDLDGSIHLNWMDHEDLRRKLEAGNFLEALDNISNSRKKPTSDTCSLFVEFLVKNRSIQHAHDLIKNYRKNNIPLHFDSYANLFTHYSNVFDYDNLQKIVEELNENQIDIPTRELPMLLNMYRVKNDEESFLTTWEKIHNDPDIKLTTRNCLEVISFYGERDNLEGIKTIITKMLENNIIAPEETFYYCCKYWIKKRNLRLLDQYVTGLLEYENSPLSCFVSCFGSFLYILLIVFILK